MIDLDGVATSPVLPEVIDAMLPWLGERHANPASAHAPGRAASRALEDAREGVAALVGVAADRIVFTSGATESNNLAVRGAARLALDRGNATVAVPAHEHPSLLHPARTLARSGFELRPLPVNRDGLVDPAIAGLDDCGVVAVSHAHAELGALQPLPAITAAARRTGAISVVDATLTAGRIRIDPSSIGGPDLVSISLHHLGGPMGVGALVRVTDLPLPPMIEGGTQERGYRPGSPNLAGCVGAGVAARLALQDLASRTSRLTSAGRAMADAMIEIAGAALTGPSVENRLPGHLSLTVAGLDGLSVVTGLEQHGILAATGSPCRDEATLASAALRAAGYSEHERRGAVVLCVPPTGQVTQSDLALVADALGEEIERLRRVAGSLAGDPG